MDTEQDKKLWYEAWKMVRDMAPWQIRNWLASQYDKDYREDMRQRLNVCRENQKARERRNAG